MLYSVTEHVLRFLNSQSLVKSLPDRTCVTFPMDLVSARAETKSIGNMTHVLSGRDSHTSEVSPGQNMCYGSLTATSEVLRIVLVVLLGTSK